MQNVFPRYRDASIRAAWEIYDDEGNPYALMTINYHHSYLGNKTDYNIWYAGKNKWWSINNDVNFHYKRSDLERSGYTVIKTYPEEKDECPCRNCPGNPGGRPARSLPSRCSTDWGSIEWDEGW